MNIQDARYILPNLFTLGSVFLGLQSIVWSIEGLFSAAAVAILGAGVLDGMDGRVARLTRTQSDFGAQLDSLADGVSFGVAPALLVYLYSLQGYRVGSLDLGLIVAALFAICGLLRLARFNVMAMRARKSASAGFQGVPIPMAAAMLALSVLSAERTGSVLLAGRVYYIVASLGLAALMVSTIRYPSFKKIHWSKRSVLFALLAALLLTLGMRAVTLFPSLLLAGVAYLAYGVLDTLFRRVQRAARRESQRRRDAP